MNALTVSPESERDQVELIKKTVAKGASDDELKMFLYIANKYNLDPLLKEIWFIKRAKKVKTNGNWDYPRLPNGEIDYRGAETVIMTSRDGYLKIAQNNAEYQGIISFTVREGDDFQVDAEHYQVTHKFGAKRGKIIGAWARCDRKGRLPQICFVDFAEYNADNNIWKKYPSAMIQKVSEVFVLKRQFNIEGLVTKEELSDFDIEPIIEQPQAAPKEPEPVKQLEMASQNQIQAISIRVNNLGWNDEQLRKYLDDRFKVSSRKELTKQQATEMIHELNQQPTTVEAEVVPESNETPARTLNLNDVMMASKTAEMKLNHVKDLAVRVSHGQEQWPHVGQTTLESMINNIKIIAEKYGTYDDFIAAVEKQKAV